LWGEGGVGCGGGLVAEEGGVVDEDLVWWLGWRGAGSRRWRHRRRGRQRTTGRCPSGRRTVTGSEAFRDENGGNGRPGDGDADACRRQRDHAGLLHEDRDAEPDRATGDHASDDSAATGDGGRDPRREPDQDSDARDADCRSADGGLPGIDTSDDEVCVPPTVVGSADELEDSSSIFRECAEVEFTLDFVDV